MSNNFHKNSFDDATQLKLEVYRRYIKSWLPVFISRKPDRNWNGKINIFDFFCGPGMDNEGNDGSPLIAVRSCLEYEKLLTKNGSTISLYFNDDKPSKIEKLNSVLEELNIPSSIAYETSSEAFGHAFVRKMKHISGSANLLFIDQCGIKEVTPKVFHTLIGLKGTDFLFFIASSFLGRFKDSPEFKKYLDVCNHLDGSTEHHDSHRAIADMYRDMIPAGTEYYIAPFTLKKKRNIYGLIFGTGNLLGILKFLQVCWEIDPERGEANFDIDGDQLPNNSGDNFDLFKSNTTASKVEVFQKNLENSLRMGNFITDRAVFIHALENGFIPVKHAKPVIMKLIKECVLICDALPRLSKACIKEPRNIRLC
ncbi:MAG: three-Cys-motif partner protein TcmP [Gammaproteobacteria bacterium]|nr:three-Cys-motif partner protein TcmP [Gammaproteobacteria bacterium]